MKFAGAGYLLYNDHPPNLLSNNYALPEKQFGLYYTSAAFVRQSFQNLDVR